LIAKSNPGVKLPDAPINVVVRADSILTTYVFTKHLNRFSKEFDEVQMDLRTFLKMSALVGGFILELTLRAQSASLVDRNYVKGYHVSSKNCYCF
jgi:hypothetical protein